MFNACQLKTVVLLLLLLLLLRRYKTPSIRWILLQSWLVSAQCLADRPQNVTETARWDHLKCSGLFQSLGAEAWLSSRHILLLPQPVRLDGSPVLTSCFFSWLGDRCGCNMVLGNPFSDWLYTLGRCLYQILVDMTGWRGSQPQNHFWLCFWFERIVFLGSWLLSQKDVSYVLVEDSIQHSKGVWVRTDSKGVLEKSYEVLSNLGVHGLIRKMYFLFYWLIHFHSLDNLSTLNVYSL